MYIIKYADFLDDEDEAEDVDLEIFQRRNFFNDEDDDDWH